VAARRALAQDAELAGLNVGVTVRGGVADVWGSVPSAALAGRVAERVRQIPGLAAVRCELAVVPRPEAAERPPDEAPPAATERAAPADGALTGRAGPPGVAPARPASEPSSPRVSPSAAVTLGPPAAAPDSPGAGPRPLAGLGRPVALPNDTGKGTAPPDPAAAVEQLRRGDGRFRGLRPEVRGGVVTVGGAVRRGEDLMAFARAVSRLPGVERVLLSPVQVDSRP
jgi:hypothetical protein